MEEDPLIKGRITSDDDDDDPLVSNQNRIQNSAKPKPSEKLFETWTSLLEIAKQGKSNQFKTSKSSLRERLSALREDELDESNAIIKVKNRSSRRWVLEQLSRDIQLWWERNDRSKSLRAASLLASALSTCFDEKEYSQEWVLVIHGLNKLSDLLSLYLSSLLGEEFDAARLNWYHKVGTTRGLVSRLYLQSSLRSVMSPDEDPGRLYTQAQGISDPLVYHYFIAYLSSVASLNIESLIRDNLQLKQKRENVSNLELVLPISLALSNCKEGFDNQNGFLRALDSCSSAVALLALLKVSTPQLCADCSGRILEVVELCSPWKAQLISLFAEKLLLCNDLVESQAKSTMNSAWLILKSEDDSEGIISCLAKFLELCAKRFGVREIFVLIRDLEKRVRESGASKINQTVMRALSTLCDRVESDPTKFLSLVSSDAFCRLFESLPNSFDNSSFALSSPKIEMAKRLLNLYFVHQVDISAALDWARCLNDSLHILTFDDERRSTNEYIRKFVQRTIFLAQSSLPEEARFSLYVDLRGRFFNSEQTIKTLVCTVGLLAKKTKNREMCSSCLAFCHATIPSIQNSVERGFLYAQIAVLAASLGRLPQCDGLFKACIQCVADSVDEIEIRALELVRTVSSSLVVAPGYPNAFYLVRGFINAVDKRTNWSNGLPHIAILNLIETLTRVKLPYRVSGADSNDVLFGDDAINYSNEALTLAKIQEAKITQHYQDLLKVSTMIMTSIRQNIVKRADQVSRQN